MPEGKIVTFYSYKGGTGRTMALANVAWILASRGLKVLVVDWDLESPGLHRYFHPFLDPAKITATSGVIEMIRDYAFAVTSEEDRPADWYLRYAQIMRHAISLNWRDFDEGGELDLVSAAGRTVTTTLRSRSLTGTTSTTGSAAVCSSTRCALT